VFEVPDLLLLCALIVSFVGFLSAFAIWIIRQSEPF
jgi:hypothetical protein